MMRYRRANVPGATYFFTVNLAERKNRLLVNNAELLKEVIRQVKSAHPFEIEAIVILPDHLHAIWTLPENDNDFSTRWGLIKAGFSRRIEKDERVSSSRKSKGERGVWQRRFWEHLIRDEKDFERHVDYVHVNPVKHGLVTQVSQWPYSSFHRYDEKGIYPENWCGDLEVSVAGDE
ncbi:MAG: transposase [Methylococcaceae bacterium]|nr:transposase [Methylococcaceae bacterium]